MRLEGKVALITGASNGMGAAEAKLFAQEGAMVAIGDRLEADGRKVEAEIVEAGGQAIFVALDVTDEENWARAVDQVVARFGKLDVLVNNAGISGSGETDFRSTDAWDRLMNVNAKGVFLGTKAAIPHMRNAGGGSIINISSIFGIVGSGGSTSYHASKGAVRLFTKSTAIQYAKESIRANSIHPGPIDTPMTEASREEREINQRFLNNTPMGRWARPEEVAFGVLYLASDESSFVTGSELVIDGGWTAQ